MRNYARKSMKTEKQTIARFSEKYLRVPLSKNSIFKFENRIIESIPSSEY